MWDKVRHSLFNYSSVVIVILLWEVVSYMGVFPPRLFPPVEKVLMAGLNVVGSGQIWENLWDTLYRLGVGFILSLVIGVVLGIFMARNTALDAWIQPIFSFGYPLPRIALYPIVILIFGIDSSSKIFMIFMECIFPIVLNTYYGMKRVNHLYIWSGENMGANKKQLFWRVMLPATMPSIFTGIRIALPLALVITVLTEMIGATTGLGYLLSFMSSSLKQDAVLSVIIIVGLIGFLFDRVLQVVKKKYVYW